MEPIERVRLAIQAIREGNMVILVDDEDRENEGDLVLAGDHVTPEAINFMALHARGLICLALDDAQVDRLGLPMMAQNSEGGRRTAFTVSIEAREGVTTGISAADRARTIQAAVSAKATPFDIVTPGHIFPLRARKGGVLQRSGHTEGAVDLARLAGLGPNGVICEIMNEDGTMARRADLERFASQHGFLMLSIADLIEYRLQNETLVEVIDEGDVLLRGRSNWHATVFGSASDARQFLALSYGEPGPDPTLVRVHTGSILGDVFRVADKRRAEIDRVVDMIEADGRGVILFLPGQVHLENDLRFYCRPEEQLRSQASADSLREFGIGAQVLRALGLRRIRLLTNRPRRIVGLDGFGLEVVEQIMVSEGRSVTELHH